LTFDPNQPQSNEAAKIKWEIVPYTRGMGLDLGCSYYKPFRHFIGVDNLSYHGENMSSNEELMLRLSVDVVADAQRLPMFSSQSMDFVFSSHLLEDFKDTESVLREWWRVIRPAGHLVLYLPHKELFPNIGTYSSNHSHEHDFIPQDIIDIMKSVGGWDLVVNETRKSGNEYSFFQVYKKFERKTDHMYSCNLPLPEKRAGVVRYGGVGDCIQTSSVLRKLREQEYDITFFCNPNNMELMRHDPNIDHFFVQDKNQVPPDNLFEFWKYWSKKFDKWINFSESVEGSYLVLPGRPPFYWPTSARHRYMNHNYLEMMHEIAGVEFDPFPRFYATLEERQWAKKQKKKIGKCILWALSGSGINKAWPYLDNAVAQIMLNLPDWKVVFVGSEFDQILEVGWENEPRVLKRCGKWTIRESLAFAHEADIIVGPETGVMNAVSFLDIKKILFLSHSSIENISRDWYNCISLYSDKCECYPCHKMIYGWEHCNRDEKTGVAKCQSQITPHDFWLALLKHIG